MESLAVTAYTHAMKTGAYHVVQIVKTLQKITRDLLNSVLLLAVTKSSISLVYQKRYDGLADRLDDVQVRLDEVSRAILEKQAHREKIEMFLDGMQKQECLVTGFYEDLWYGLICDSF